LESCNSLLSPRAGGIRKTITVQRHGGAKKGHEDPNKRSQAGNHQRDIVRILILSRSGLRRKLGLKLGG